VRDTGKTKGIFRRTIPSTLILKATAAAQVAESARVAAAGRRGLKRRGVMRCRYVERKAVAGKAAYGNAAAK